MKQSTKELCQLELGYMHHRIIELRNDVQDEKHFALNEILFALGEHIFSVEQAIKHF